MAYNSSYFTAKYFKSGVGNSVTLRDSGMATALCHRQEVGSWSSIFPADQLTEQKSAFFVKKLLAVSVSYLTYLRNIFPGRLATLTEQKLYCRLKSVNNDYLSYLNDNSIFRASFWEP